MATSLKRRHLFLNFGNKSTLQLRKRTRPLKIISIKVCAGGRLAPASWSLTF